MLFQTDFSAPPPTQGMLVPDFYSIKRGTLYL
jgi:hypothetical protein